VGYPGEDQAAFEETVALADEVGFDGLFVFMYSPRPGTTAWRRDDDVPEDEKLRRLKVLNDRQQRYQAVRNAARVGGVEEVLVDTVGEDGRVSGRTRDFRIVHTDGTAADLGRLLRIAITGSGPNSLTGKRSDNSVAGLPPNPVS
jgi:tRNA-2-methylthio-N6-dimethylallyladenosine synthase